MNSSTLALYQKIETWISLGILSEVRFKATTSGGKGGQHVNKVSSRIELYWVPADSYLLEEEVKERLLKKLASKLSQEGELRIVSDEERSQLQNKQKAIEKFYKLVTACFKEPKKRKPTKPTKASVKKRLEGKSIKKNIKANRSRPDIE
jgi:ribosome-associated protein